MELSPGRIARELGLPAPTDEQAAVIAAPPGPMLVVAGAGAGKTETMAWRVVWMVANGYVTPEQVLGLTFTRKAAQQLTARIRNRLARLAGSGLVATARDTAQWGEPEVSTYHAYAGRLVSEHGLLLPVEPSAHLLTETELWQLAYRVVTRWDTALDESRLPASLTETVLAVMGQLDEHLVDSDTVRAEARRLEQLVWALPPAHRQSKNPKQELLKIVDTANRRADLLDVVDELVRRMRETNVVDFGSRMAAAARLALGHPQVGAVERDRIRLVLLDEYQDTGHAQRLLLSALFGGGVAGAPSVTAVGDPMQSIYGWRGASAANLPRFTTDFPRHGGAPAAVGELLTSWRNPPEVLDVANHIADPLRTGGVPVSRLRSRPDARSGTVTAALWADIETERARVAEWIDAEYAAAAREGKPPPTAAVLVRRNADAEPIADALRERGLPVEVVGLGGLLHTPEVADIVAVLRILADPSDGGAAMRVLTGARWQIGAADLTTLWRRARRLTDRPATPTPGVVIAPEILRTDPAGLIDAVADPGPAEHYSAEGGRRIAALADELERLRRRVGRPLTELVADVEAMIGIGPEATTRTLARGSGRATIVAGREQLDTFADVVARFDRSGDASLDALLAYFDAADTIEDGLPIGEVEVSEHRVQVLTVHAAKGLEWEVVAVPHVSDRIFPSTGKGLSTWMSVPQELPPDLRGDRVGEGEVGGFPRLNLDDVTDRKQLEEAFERHKQVLVRRRDDEERRLFYVAVTRAERTVMISGAQWTGASKPNGPSRFLEEVLDLGAEGAVTVPERAEAGIDNPIVTVGRSALWPDDRLGVRRAGIEEGAELVRAALARGPANSGEAADEYDDPEGWAADVERLLADRAQPDVDVTAVVLPSHLSVSRLVDLAKDREEFAQRLRRPLPYRPNPFARNGTAFHAWLERRYGATRLLDLDELPGAADTTAATSGPLEELQRAFEASPWARRTPIDIESPFETTIGTTVLRGRIDAIFADPDGGWTVVDWKTGNPPADDEVAAIEVQLAAYRIAWARLMTAETGAEVSLDRVRAAFHYVRVGRTITSTGLPDADALARLLDGDTAAVAETVPDDAGATPTADRPTPTVSQDPTSEAPGAGRRSGDTTREQRGRRQRPRTIDPSDDQPGLW
nr:UvrD-helicase domain-containing protein [Millisia brevis]